MNPCTIPTPAEDRQPDGRWMNVHNRYLSETKEKEPEVIFLGDSIFQFFQFMEMWNTCFAPIHALNFGIGGDSVQHVLWRILNGELDNVSPKHNRYLSETKEKEPEVIFLGDSIFQYFQFMEMWNTCFAPMHALNFGIGGDSVQHVLWRILNGELDNVSPKVIVLLVGTNNSEKPEQIVEGILEIIKTAQEKQPQAHLLVVELLPRGLTPNPARTRNEEVNAILKDKLNGIPQCELVKVGNGLVQPDGTISHHDMFDYLHLTNAGYLKAFEPLHEILLQILSENEPEKDLTPSE